MRSTRKTRKKMALQEGRFTASADGRKQGITLLVPRNVGEAEQRKGIKGWDRQE